MMIDWADPGDAAAVADQVAAVVGRTGEKRIAVPGGSTPRKIFDLLAARHLDWSGTEVWLTDDRRVPHDHRASNFGQLAAVLGDSEATLVELREGGSAPRFDLVWLGMGSDGHIASLFPKMAAKECSGPHVIATVPDPLPAEAPFPRLSLNLEALTQATEILVVVNGDEKRAVLESALRGEAEHLPIAQLFRAATSPVTIYWSP